MEGLLALILLAFWIWAVIWVYRDAEERKGMGCLIAILVVLTGPIGLLLWVLLRPERDYYQ